MRCLVRRAGDVLPTAAAAAAADRRRHAHSFSVLHWNVLAKSFARNTNPWFLHGIHLGKDRRHEIFVDYFARDERTKELKNPGWPSFAKRVLSSEEMNIVERVDAETFAWPMRFEAIKRLVSLQHASVISLVELDAFEELAETLQEQGGYDGEFVLRPRITSRDGCAIFWKRAEWRVVNKSRLTFVDKYDPDPYRDRCALLVLLEKRETGEVIAFASTHLARDMFGEPPRDAVRARQLGELLREVRTLMLSSNQPIDSTPVVICGDVNENELANLTGLVLVTSLLASSAHLLHPCIFAIEAVDCPRGATSRTEARDVRVDAILFSSASLEARNLDFIGIDEHRNRDVIPNPIVPSDHFPILSIFEKKSQEKSTSDAIKKWWSVVFPRTQQDKTRKPPVQDDLWNTESQMSASDLSMAFKRITAADRDVITEDSALDSLRRLGLLESVSHAVKQKWVRENIIRVANNQERCALDFVDFVSLYFTRHPVCEKCATVAFAHIDRFPRNDVIQRNELELFFRPFHSSVLEGDANAIFQDAVARELATPEGGMTFTQFKLLLGAKFVETTFQDTALRRNILDRMTHPAFRNSIAE